MNDGSGDGGEALFGLWRTGGAGGSPLRLLRRSARRHRTSGRERHKPDPAGRHARAAGSAALPSVPAPVTAHSTAHAPFWRRAVAALLDLVQLSIIQIVALFMAVGLGLMASGELTGAADRLLPLGDPIQLLSLVVAWLYDTLFEAGP